MRCQQADDIGMPLGRGPHQRRLSAEIFFRVHFSAMLEQNLHGVHIAVARCFHQHCFGLRGDQRIGVRAGFEQLFDQRGSADADRFRQRRRAVTVERGRVRARREQRVHGFQIAPVRGPMQRRGAIGFRSIHVHMLFQQRADGLGVLILHGVHQRGIAVGGGESGDRQQRRERAFD